MSGRLRATMVAGSMVVLLTTGCSGPPADTPGSTSGAASTSDAAPASPATTAHPPQIGTELERIPLLGAPLNLGSGFGSVWVTEDTTEGGILERIDPAIHTSIAQIPVGGFPVGIVAGFNSLWVANHNDGTLSRIDPQANTVIATIPVGPGPAEIAAAGGSVWVANNDATLARVDPGTNRRVQLVRVGRGAKFRPIHAGGGSVWTLNTDGSISRLNSRTGAITATIPIKGCCEGDIWIASDAVWVTNVGDASVYRIDPSTNQVVKRFTVEKTPSGIALTNGLVWNTHGDTGLITWRSPDTGRTLGSVKFQGFVSSMLPVNDGSLWIQAIDYSAIVRLATG